MPEQEPHQPPDSLSPQPPAKEPAGRRGVLWVWLLALACAAGCGGLGAPLGMLLTWGELEDAALLGVLGGALLGLVGGRCLPWILATPVRGMVILGLAGGGVFALGAHWFLSH